MATGFTMSLDGFIAAGDGDIGTLFKWYYGGDRSAAGRQGYLDGDVGKTGGSQPFAYEKAMFEVRTRTQRDAF